MLVAVTMIATTWFALDTIVVMITIGVWTVVGAAAVAYTVATNGVIAYLPPATQRMLLQQYAPSSPHSVITCV